MAAQWHTREEQRRAVAQGPDHFPGDGGRQVYGRLGAQGRLVLLPELGPEALVPHDQLNRTFRQAVAGRDIYCPVPGCVAFAKVRGGAARAFVHPDGHQGHPTGTAQESVWHLQAKETLRRWLVEQVGASVQVDDTVLRSARGETVKPDVLATLPGGQRLAFEAQYSDLNPRSDRKGRGPADDRPEWRRRQDVYDELGADGALQVVWLFAAAGHYWRPRPPWGTKVTVAPAPPVLQMLQARAAVHWFSPVHGRIATPYLWIPGKRLQPHSRERWQDPLPTARAAGVRPWRNDHTELLLHAGALRDCSLEAGTFTTPGDHMIARTSELRQRHEADLRAHARAEAAAAAVAAAAADTATATTACMDSFTPATPATDPQLQPEPRQDAEPTSELPTQPERPSDGYKPDRAPEHGFLRRLVPWLRRLFVTDGRHP